MFMDARWPFPSRVFSLCASSPPTPSGRHVGMPDEMSFQIKPAEVVVCYAVLGGPALMPGA